MEGLSRKELEVISDLEFRKKYYFTRDDIYIHYYNKKQMTNSLYILGKKGRIVRLNRNKYFLVPIKARTGKWSDDPRVMIDEIFNGKDYFIGGWFAAYYWKLSDQIPLQIDVYTTKRQGKKTILSTKLHFHRTTAKRIDNATVRYIQNRQFRVLSKTNTEKWMKLRS